MLKKKPLQKIIVAILSFCVIFFSTQSIVNYFIFATSACTLAAREPAVKLEEYDEWSTKLKKALKNGQWFNVGMWRAYKSGELKELPGD